MDKPVDNFITRREASQYLNISLSTLDRLLRSRQIPFVKLGGRVYFTKAQLNEWVESLKVGVNHGL